MKNQGCTPVGCHSEAASVGGVAAADFAALDELAVKLISLDGGFATPLRQMGRTLGKRIAAERVGASVPFETALSALMSACGLADVVESRFLHRNANGARLQITGCSEVLGWPIENVGRAVCGFDAGLFEGFLCGATDQPWNVQETACLGLGHPSCEFAILRGGA